MRMCDSLSRNWLVIEYGVRSRSACTTEFYQRAENARARCAERPTSWRRLAFFVAPTAAMSYLLPHLRSGWAVDQAILTEEERVVVIRFGRDADATCMRMDEVRDPSFPPSRARSAPSDVRSRLGRAAPLPRELTRPIPSPTRRPSPASRIR